MKQIKGGGAGLLLERKIDTGASEIWKVTERLAKDFDIKAPGWVFLTSGTSFGYGITTTEYFEHEMLVLPIFLSKFCSDQEFEAFAALALVSHDAETEADFFTRDRLLAAKLGDRLTAQSILKKEIYSALWNGVLKICDEKMLKGERTELPLKAFEEGVQILSIEMAMFKLNTEINWSSSPNLQARLEMLGFKPEELVSSLISQGLRRNQFITDGFEPKEIEIFSVRAERLFSGNQKAG